MTPEPHSALDRTQGRRSGSCAGAPAVVAVARRLRDRHRAFLVRWLRRGGCFGVVVQSGRGRAFQLLVPSSPPHPHGFRDVGPAPALSSPPGEAEKTVLSQGQSAEFPTS